MDKINFFKLPRLYSAQSLSDKSSIHLSTDQAHYLRNVLRLNEGSHIRLFDGQCGEYLCSLQSSGKKEAIVDIIEKIAEQPSNTKNVHFYFTPIKKQRLDWMIEKAVELGATHFHPILTQNTDIRKINTERLQSQIKEAAEQCERFVIPSITSLTKMEDKISDKSDIMIYSCLERFDGIKLVSKEKSIDTYGVLIGPEGGFTTKEKEFLAKKTIPISLGETVLRCETAAVKALILLEKET